MLYFELWAAPCCTLISRLWVPPGAWATPSFQL